MSGAGTIKKFKNGEVIFREGEPSGSAYVIVKGSVELTKNSKHGAVLLAKLKSGELFGEMGVIDGSPRSATSRSIGATTVKEITPEASLLDAELMMKEARITSLIVKSGQTLIGLIAKHQIDQLTS